MTVHGDPDMRPFWYRESNMMDRQLNKGSRKIAFAVHAGAQPLIHCRDTSFTIPGMSADEQKVCPVDCIHILQTVPEGDTRPAVVEGGRAC